MTTNIELKSISKSINNFYKNFISDNKYFFNYLSDIESYNTDDKFANMVMNVLKTSISTDYLMLYKPNLSILNNKNEIIYLKDISKNDSTVFMDSLYIISRIYGIFANELDNHPSGIELLNSIKKVKIDIFENDDSNDDSCLIEVDNTQITFLIRNINLLSNRQMILINPNSSNIEEFIELKNLQYTPISGMLFNIIVKNFIYYLFNMKTLNVKIQTNAIYNFISLVRKYANIQLYSELIISNDFNNEIYKNRMCNELSTIQNELKVMITDINPRDSVLINGIQVTSIIPTLEKDTFEIKQLQNKVNINDPDIYDFIIYNPKIFETRTFILTQPHNNDINNPYIARNIKTINFRTIQRDGVDIKIISSVQFDIGDDNFFKVYGQGGSKVTTFELRSKTLDDFKREYVSSGIDLRNINKNIEEYKKKVNKVVNTYDKNKNRNIKLNYHTVIFYIIFAILTIINIGLMLSESIDTSIKQIIVIGLIIFVIAMIIYNHFNRYIYLEYFTNFETRTLISNIGDCPSGNSSTSDKINYIQNHLNIFNSNAVIFINTLTVYLPSLETKDLYNKLSTAISNEKATFGNIQKSYYLKEKEANENTNLLIHNIISNFYFLHLISYFYLVFSIVYFAYMIEPELIRLYIFIGLIFYILVIWIYYVNITQPTRTSSSHKYWIKPAESILTQSGVDAQNK